MSSNCEARIDNIILSTFSEKKRVKNILWLFVKVVEKIIIVWRISWLLLQKLEYGTQVDWWNWTQFWKKCSSVNWIFPNDFWGPFLKNFGMAIVSLIPRGCALLVEWPSTWTHDRPLWLKKPSSIVLDRSLWLKWPFSLAQDRPLLNGPSTFARLSALRTVHQTRFEFPTAQNDRATKNKFRYRTSIWPAIWTWIWAKSFKI